MAKAHQIDSINVYIKSLLMKFITSRAQAYNTIFGLNRSSQSDAFSFRTLFF